MQAESSFHFCDAMLCHAVVWCLSVCPCVTYCMDTST